MEMTAKIEELMNRIKLDEYWPEFRSVAYALYNTDEVHLVNHPYTNFQTQTIPSEPVFNGADTVILYHNHPTAIVNLERYETFESLYPILVHELFHGYQYLYGEKRFPDELMGSQYPLMAENIELRGLEREQLYSAVLTNSQEALSNFIALREKRKALIGKYADYECLIESVEGTAWYVEFLASMKISGLPNEKILEKYSPYLLNRLESNLNIRRSGYGSGMFMCLYLDTTAGDWKHKFVESDLTLYEFLKENIEWHRQSVSDEIQVNQETWELINLIKSNRIKKFKEFEEQGIYSLIIEGKFDSIYFDPINMITFENKTLHQYLRVMAGNREYIFTQPVITIFKDQFKDVFRLHLRMKNKPKISNSGLIIEDVGEISGDMIECGNDFTIKI
ncbi:MAG: hypothetical protein WB217_01260 [Mesobacillus sp.]|uniref:hypothetical protein n=1 Tax=Mesobacillus sp. TaxID=2675271 RepID=UPI003C48D739